MLTKANIPMNPFCFMTKLDSLLDKKEIKSKRIEKPQ